MVTSVDDLHWLQGGGNYSIGTKRKGKQEGGKKGVR